MIVAEAADAKPQTLAGLLLEGDVVSCPGWADGELVAGLRERAQEIHAAEGFRRARVGKGGAAVVDDQERGDEVHWLEAGRDGAIDRLLKRYEALRAAVNVASFAGLFDWEGHFAIYPAGRGYRRHVDRFRDDDRRTLSTVLYLNDSWAPEHGGALEVWSPDAPRDAPPAAVVEPQAGTLVLFWSDRIPHAVATSHRPRWSIAGWFRRR